MAMMDLLRDGGKMIIDVEEIKDIVTGLTRENSTLRTLVEKQGAIIVSLNEQMGEFSRKLNSMEDTLTSNAQSTDDMKRKTYVGKKAEFLKESIEEVKSLTHKDIRRLIFRAAGNQRGGYLRIYSKLSDMTGIDIYSAGKNAVRKNDGLGFVNPQKTYINTVFLKGVQYEAAAISLDIIRNR